MFLFVFTRKVEILNNFDEYKLCIDSLMAKIISEISVAIDQ